VNLRLRADTATAIIALAVAAFITAEGRTLGIGSTNDPGSGFILFWVGLAMAALSLALLVQSLRPSAEATTLGAPFAVGRWGKVIYVVVLLVAYTYVLDEIGFIIATFALLVLLFKTVEPQSWLVSLTGSALATGAAWLVFVAWLGTQLPAGLLGLG
jgi:putative tricarboxylic transport membrane protein